MPNENTLDIDRSISKYLLSSSTWVFVIRFAKSGIVLLVNALITRFLKVEQVGEYVLIFSVVITMAQFGAFGFDLVATRFIAEAIGSEEQVKARGIAFHVFKQVVFFASGSSLGLYLLWRIFGQFFSDLSLEHDVV
jgi:O-antigen/teichoic acid export membrane protein